MKMHKILNKKKKQNKYIKYRQKFNFALSVRRRIDGVSGPMVAYLIIIYIKNNKTNKIKKRHSKFEQDAAT
jgi:hypothetical protein